jgi:hypothetical protein
MDHSANTISVSSIRGFLVNNWLKLLITGAALFLFFQKDFSFQINLKAPEENIELQAPISRPDGASQKEEFTERQGETGISATAPKKDLFRIAPFLSADGKEGILWKELKQISDETKIAYLKRFARVAIDERKKFGIPSSIILANGLLHSLSGERDLAMQANNHFAILCSENWSGSHSEFQGQCVRHYKSSWASFRDHSKHLTSGRFQRFPEFGPTDYEAWARALESAGYSSEPQLAERLTELIRYFKLYELDTK